MRVMNKLFTGIIILILITGCKESNVSEGAESSKTRLAADETEGNIYQAGDSMLSAFRRKDWITFVRYNHPNMTKRMGGSEAFASFINVQMNLIPDSAIESISLGKILQVVKTSGDMQCLVEQNLKLQLYGKTMIKTTYLIGESLDNGKNWTFFDASTKTALSLKDINRGVRIKHCRNMVFF